MTSLSQKTLNNSLTRSNKKEIVGWGMPDYTAGVDIKGYNSSDNQFTPTVDGIVCISKTLNVQMYINNSSINDPSSNATGGDSCFVPLPKGDSFYWTGGSMNTATFYPAKGE